MSTSSTKKKGFISEGDIALLLRRYNASTILALLHEIASSATAKLNWETLVKNSNTGIKNAREYQALWRHLAYRINIADGFEDDSQPLEDDSDLEFEVEPLPGVSPQVAGEVAACVKALATTVPSNGHSTKSIALEAAAVIDIPNSASGWDVKGNGQISGTTPHSHASNVSVQSPGAGLASEIQPPRKKRKFWTPEEDQELVAAVEKCGEGNWAMILKGCFKHDRTASQLSQRWALIRKRREGCTGVNHTNPPTGQLNNAGGVQANTHADSLLSPVIADELHVTTATVGVSSTSVSAATGNNGLVSVAVSSSSPIQLPSLELSSIRTTTSKVTLPPSGKNRPLTKKSSLSVSQSAGGRRLIIPGVAIATSASQAAPGKGIEILQTKMMPTTVPLSMLKPATTSSGRFNVSSGLRNSSVSSLGRGSLKSSTGPDPMVQAAAVAAGARIAPASAAASLLKAAHSRNVVHIGPAGVSMGKPGISSQGGSSMVTSAMRAGTSSAGSRSSSGAIVHYIRTGTGATSPSLLLTGLRPSQLQSKNNMGRPAHSNHLMRMSANPLQISSMHASISSGPLISSQPQKGFSPASATVPTLKPKPKLQTSTAAGDQNSNAVPDTTGDHTASVDVILSDTMLTSSSRNADECASVEQIVDTTVGSFANVSSCQSFCEVASDILPPSLVVTDAGLSCGLSSVANVPDSVNCSTLSTFKNSTPSSLSELPQPELQQSESNVVNSQLLLVEGSGDHASKISTG